MGEGHHPAVDDVLTAIDDIVDRARGDAARVAALIDRSPLPMHLLDNERRYVEANRPGCLLFRLTREQIVSLRPDELTRTEDISGLEHMWSTLLCDGFLSGQYTFAFADGTEVEVVFHATANVIPGRHLTVFVPATWCEDDLEGLDVALTDPAPGDPLSPRESEVIRLAAGGAELEELSTALGLSPHTVKVHLRNIYRKLGARNRAHAVAIAFRRDLI